MSNTRRERLEGWIVTNREFRKHQGSCSQCAASFDPIGCEIAFQLYQARESARIELEITE